LPVSSLSCTAN